MSVSLKAARATGDEMRILIIEDDAQTARYIDAGLRDAGHAADVSYDGQQGLKLAAVERYDVLVVDRMLPGLDGLSIVQSLRNIGVNTPILFLTSLGGVDDRIEGLEAGADDYLVKPFDRAELIARINALARRGRGPQEATILKAADVQMNLITREVTRAGQPISLQPREFKLLEVLIRHKDQLVTRAMLLEKVWELHFDPKTSIVETHMSRLRSKLEQPFNRPLIRNVRGAGYCLDEHT